jgi:serine protease inhibitor
MTRLIALMLALASIATACAASGTGDTPQPLVPPPRQEGPPTTSESPDPAALTPIVPVLDRRQADANAAADEWVAGINAAGWNFNRQLEGNAVSSPVSIGIAFSLARAGASPDTGEVLDEIFAFPSENLHAAANTVDLKLAEASIDSTTLEVANRLFLDHQFSPLPAFLDTAAGYYGATIQPVDTNDGAAAADVINGWVSETTRGLIPTIVNEAVVQDQELILVNTVYLKADWVEQFLPGLTRDGQFTTDTGSTVTTPFMRDREPVQRRFVRLDDADAVELPYVGDQLAMWLIIPREDDGLARLEALLDASSVASLADSAEEGMVDLTMPKWEQTLPPTNLFDWLCPLGFCTGAAFDNIAPGIFITAAVHGAKVIVDEKGTEAAAATALVFTESGPPPADLTIVADRPFLWAIVHEDTGAILFLGRLVDPTT